eukprot:scaffold3343_cov99-Skeletonema_marinoi.AAC.9
MASTSLSSSGFEDHDHLNMFAAAANDGNDNNSLQLLEEGLSDNIIDNSTHGNENSGAQQQQQHDRSQQEAVALLAFNKAFEQNKSSSSSSSSSINIEVSSKNNTPSRTATSLSSASAILQASHGGIVHKDDSTHATIKVEAPSSKPMQHSPGSTVNDDNNDDDDISLNSADLQSPGGFDGSMSLSDFLMDDSRPKPNNTPNNGSSSQFDSSSKSSFNIDKTFKSSNVNNIKGGARWIHRHSSSITSTGSSGVVGESSNHSNSNNKFMSSLSFRNEEGSSINSNSNENNNFGLIRNNTTSRQKQLHQQQQQQRLLRQQQQQQQHDNNNDSNNNNSWKGSSALSITTCNSTTGNSSILNPLKKKHSRVSWQIRDDDLEKDLSFATAGGSKPSFLGSKPSFFGSSSNNSSAATPSSRPSKRNSSWTITDLECLTNNSPNNVAEGGNGYEGDDSSSSQFQMIGSSSAKSILTPEEQHLWASMLQLANMSGTTIRSNDVNGGDHVGGDTVDASEESTALSTTKSIQDAMNVAAAAILQTDAAMGRDAVGDAAPDGDRVEGMTSLAAPIEGSSLNPPRSTSPSLQAPPPQQPSLSTDITPATAVTVTTLAYQEVEEYRERLRRKREEMEGIDSSYSSQQQQQQQSPPPTELSDLNSLLLENATNINNAVLLQRALYALRIHRGSLMDGNNTIDTSNNNNNVNGDASDQPTSLSRCRFSRSEHSGLDHLALNHLLTLSSSVRSSGTAGSGSGRNSNSTWRTAAQAAAASLTRSSQPPSPPAVSTADNVQRRHTLLGTQPGAYCDPNPAPLLFRRTFANPNRRESRQAARRNTLDALHSQRTSNVTTDSGSSVGYQQQRDQQNQPQLQHRRTSSLDSGAGSAANNDSSQNMDEAFANTLQYPSTHNDAPENSITAQVTPYNPDESYNRRHLGTLLESTQSQQSTSSINTHTDRRALFGAQSSFRRQSRRALQMIQAVLVSDEIVEAVEAEHIPNGDGFLFPNDLERMDMMEELLEEKEEEARMIEDRYRRRERVWMVVVTVLVVVVVALVVTAAKR